ncbi:MAG: tetratricopeptide repeat protein [Promethearchaeota archaeon]
MHNSELKELPYVEQLKNECKFIEALKILNELEDKKELTLQGQFEIHYFKSVLLNELGRMNEALKYVELAYKESQQLKINPQIFDVLLSKSTILSHTNKNKEALKTIIKAEELLQTIDQISLKEFKEKKTSLLLSKGGIYFNIGDLNQALKCIDEAFMIAKEIENDKLILRASKLLDFVYYCKGDFNLSFEYLKIFLTLAKKLNDKQEIIGALNGIGMVYTEKGDFNQALECLKQSLSICEEINSFKTGVVLTSLVDLYLKMNSLEKAKLYLDRIKKIINQEYNKWLDDGYRVLKAIFFQKQSQKVYHLKAIDLLKRIVNEEGTFIETQYEALIYLCDLYLKELSETNDLKIIDGIQPYLIQLKEIAKTQQSSWLLAEAYSFHAKLKLITSEFEEAKDLLSRARDITKMYGLTQLAERISKELIELANQESKWEMIKGSKASMAELLNLTHIEDQLTNMLKKRFLLKKAL